MLGDGNDIFLVVEGGLEVGDEVALSPQAVVAEMDDTLKPLEADKSKRNVTGTVEAADQGGEGVGNE